MYIGEAAKTTGASIKAIRLYEQMGLLTNIDRINTYRVYTTEDILLIRFIRLAQAHDFTLAEIKRVMQSKHSSPRWYLIREAIEEKMQHISKEILRLQGNLKQLRSYQREIDKCLMNKEKCLFPPTNIAY